MTQSDLNYLGRTVDQSLVLLQHVPKGSLYDCVALGIIRLELHIHGLQLVKYLLGMINEIIRFFVIEMTVHLGQCSKESGII